VIVNLSEADKSDESCEQIGKLKKRLRSCTNYI